MKRRPLNLKPRNPVAVALRTKRGGAHGKARKAVRQQEKQALARDLTTAEDKAE